jgi:hypothetical protein
VKATVKYRFKEKGTNVGIDIEELEGKQWPSARDHP